MLVELTCVSSGSIKKDWSSGEAVFGELKQGVLLRLTAAEAVALLDPDCTVLNALGK